MHACQEAECARLIAGSPVVKLVHHVLGDKRDDDDVVVQVIEAPCTVLRLNSNSSFAVSHLPYICIFCLKVSHR